jgi:hypothetical protein
VGVAALARIGFLPNPVLPAVEALARLLCQQPLCVRRALSLTDARVCDAAKPPFVTVRSWPTSPFAHPRRKQPLGEQASVVKDRLRARFGTRGSGHKLPATTDCLRVG